MGCLDYAAIKRDATLWMLLDALDWRPSWREGRRARGPCPIHSSGSASSRTFAVSDADWYCHKCRRGGGAVELVMQLRGMNAYQAALQLCDLVGIRPTYLPRRKRAARPAEQEEAR